MRRRRKSPSTRPIPFIFQTNTHLSAAKTALLLDNTKLGDSHVKVEAGQGLDQLASGKTATPGDDTSKDSSGDNIEQEDKPRSRILAEYIAHGYAIGDNALHRAIDLDKKHGFSNRFTAALANFDNKLKATDRAKAVDASYGVTGRAQAGWRGLQSYFEKAMETPTGQRVRAFYTQTEKQVMDIHTEARRLADLRKQEGGGSGEDASGSGSGSGGGDNKVSTIPGTDKTVCTCAGNSGNCPCEEGKCACQGCGKSSIEGHGHSATGPADDVAAATHLNPLGSNLTHEATGNADQYTGDTKVAPVGDQLGGGKTG